MLIKKIFIFLMIASAPAIQGQAKLKPFAKMHTNVPEPSDIAYNSDFSTLYIVSDQGILYETDTLGKIIRSAPYTGVDFESVYADDKNVYVADERTRRVIVYTKNNLEFVRQNEVAYSGGMNAGYEGMTYNAKRNCFVLAIEKNPNWLFEINNDLVKINEVKLNISADVSGIYYYKEFIYVLSDEDQTVFRLDPVTYKVITKWKIPVTNPEGIAFDKQGNLVIVSDFEQSIFKFRLTEPVK
jgi:uncharacterized protein YjiK